MLGLDLDGVVIDLSLVEKEKGGYVSEEGLIFVPVREVLPVSEADRVLVSGSVRAIITRWLFS